jgi:hypothetical protein
VSCIEVEIVGLGRAAACSLVRSTASRSRSATEILGLARIANHNAASSVNGLDGSTNSVAIAKRLEATIIAALNCLKKLLIVNSKMLSQI